MTTIKKPTQTDFGRAFEWVVGNSLHESQIMKGADRLANNTYFDMDFNNIGLQYLYP